MGRTVDWRVSVSEQIREYEILGLLGRGGMGAVYRVRDTMLGREHALKVIRPELAADPEVRRRFVQEAQILSRLVHPGILAVHAVFEEGGKLCMILELLSGSTLEERLARGLLDTDTACRWIREMAEAVAFAHGREPAVIHRDLKPANLFVTADDHVKVLDFGLAKAVGSGRATSTGQILGTPLYLPPEMLKGQVTAANLGPKADVFALGMVAYRLLSGRLPFDDAQRLTEDIEASQLWGQLAGYYWRELSFVPLSARAPGLPSAWSDAVMQALSQDAEMRPVDARAWLRLFPSPEAAEVESPPDPPPRPVAPAPVTPAPDPETLFHRTTDAEHPQTPRPPPAPRPATPQAPPQPRPAPVRVRDVDLDEDDLRRRRRSSPPWAFIGGSVAVAVVAGWAGMSMRDSGGSRSEPAAPPAAAREPTAAPATDPPAPRPAPATEPPRAAPDRWRELGIAPVRIEGGSYRPGTPGATDDETPPSYDVRVATFELSKTEVTVAQYRKCVNDGPCTAPQTGEYCKAEWFNWDKPDRANHPVNCVDWHQAKDFAEWSGGRLPTEAEWEWAARGRNEARKYPWGSTDPTCAVAVMNGNGGNGCGTNATWPTCQKPGGHSRDGVCDLGGNVWEWVEDAYERSGHEGIPRDGTARTGAAGADRVNRGGSWGVVDPAYFRAANRSRDTPDDRDDNLGFRVARPLP